MTNFVFSVLQVISSLCHFDSLLIVQKLAKNNKIFKKVKYQVFTLDNQSKNSNFIFC